MPILDLFWAMLWFFLFFVWIWLLITIFADIFRSDMSGWAKAAWVIFVIIVPLLGVLIYLIAQGGNMQKRSVKQAQEADAATRAYIQEAAGSGGGSSAADEVSKLAALRDAGTISDEEFAAAKAKALA
jgi:ABC-type multidrug transport system fused ATPase/permease subunit